MYKPFLLNLETLFIMTIWFSLDFATSPSFSGCEIHHQSRKIPKSKSSYDLPPVTQSCRFHYYSGWKKSCTPWDGRKPINNGINNLLSGAGFLPSTVAPWNGQGIKSRPVPHLKHRWFPTSTRAVERRWTGCFACRSTTIPLLAGAWDTRREVWMGQSSGNMDKSFINGL
jgi:hypothetical protein